MKNLFALWMTLCCLTIALAQDPGTGAWKGQLSFGGKSLDLILHLNAGPNKALTSSWDIPTQGVKEMPSSSTNLSGTALTISISTIGVTYSGTVASDSQKIEGLWKQSGMEFPLTFTPFDPSTEKAPAAKPQTPVAPFPYEVEDFTYTGTHTKITYGATLTYPKGASKIPAIVLITGSGKQDRNESILGHQPFAVLADYFTKKGFAVLRVDDRGAGKTTGDFSQSTSEDFAQDVEEHFAYLMTKPFIDAHKIGLCGHSEGGLIAPLVATRHKDIAFILLMAGPGVPILDLMSDQNQAVLLSSQIDPKAIASYLPVYRKLALTLSQNLDPQSAQKAAYAIVDEWRKNTEPKLVQSTTNITDDASERDFVQRLQKGLSSKWWQFFMNYNPQPVLEKVNCPVLAINGGADIQVIAQPNLNGIAEALKKGHNKKGTTKEFAGLNHLFQHCTECTVSEYGQLETTIEPEVLQYMGDWLQQVVK